MAAASEILFKQLRSFLTDIEFQDYKTKNVCPWGYGSMEKLGTKELCSHGFVGFVCKTIFLILYGGQAWEPSVF